MHTLENEYIRIAVADKGAELQSIQDVKTGQEYMWSGDAAFWGKHSPVLFPIVGSLKGGTYYYKNRAYQLGRHGFARDCVFELHNATYNSLSFLLQSDEETLKNYPFLFKLCIEYTLIEDKLRVTYRVVNIGEEDMYFSIGAHPAFKVPLFEGDAYSDYKLEFEVVENTGRWPINYDGLLESSDIPFFYNNNVIQLRKELFYKDAIVFKHLQSKKVKLVSIKNNKGFEISFDDFPYLGIWAAKNADFVCIEPWCGIADSVNADQQITNKEGIHQLAPGAVFVRHWEFSFIS